MEMDDKVEYDPMNDKLALKGVIWPGMDLFDSATLKNKRKRNQKTSGGGDAFTTCLRCFLSFFMSGRIAELNDASEG